MATRGNPGGPRHPMQVVTRRTGLSADLLRAWERRHGVVTPSRSASGRRLYSDADIERLRLLYRATLAGRGIGQVADLSAGALAALVRQDAAADAPYGAQAAEAEDSGAAAYLAECVSAVGRLDAVALDLILRRAAVALPAAVLLEALAAPLLDGVAMRWREGALRPVHSHLASVGVRRVLDRVIESASSPLAPLGLVVATPTGHAHEFGALFLAATAAAEGWRVTYLGAELPAEDIAEAAVRTRARAVALSLVPRPVDAALRSELRRLRRALPARVALVVGGPASPTTRAVLEEIGATELRDLADARRHLSVIRRGPRRGGRRHHA